MPSLAEFDAVVEVGGDGGASMVVWGCQNIYSSTPCSLRSGERWNERMELMGENIKKTSPRHDRFFDTSWVPRDTMRDSNSCWLGSGNKVSTLFPTINNATRPSFRPAPLGLYIRLYFFHRRVIERRSGIFIFATQLLRKVGYGSRRR